MTNQLFTSLKIAEGFLNSKFEPEKNFDLCIKEITIKNLPTLTVYVSGLINGDSLTEILSDLQRDNEEEEILDEEDYFHAHFNFFGVDLPKSIDEFLIGVLSGRVGFITKSGYCYLTEFRNYPGRNPEEPDNEKVIRGSRDGFAENIILNTALVRRRIRSEKLRFHMHHVTTYGQTDIVLSYLDDLVNERHLEWIRERLQQIDHDGLTMSDKSLEEWLFKQKYHPLPFVRYTERPGYCSCPYFRGAYCDNGRYIAFCHACPCHHVPFAAACGRISAGAAGRDNDAVPSFWSGYFKLSFTSFLVFTRNTSGIAPR